MLWLEMIIQTIAYAGGTQSERAKGAVIMMTSMSLYLGNRRRVFAHPFFIIQSGQTENQGGQTQYILAQVILQCITVTLFAQSESHL